MEHIIQFGVNIDDERIKTTIESSISKAVQDEVKSKLGGTYYQEGTINGLVKMEVERLFNLYKDDIVEKTAEKLADKLSRSKIVREKVTNELI